MTLRRFLVELVSTKHSKEVHDEEILNVLRESDRIAMGTQEIADAVGMSRQGVENRLTTLERADRVRSEKIGRVLVWDLHPDERQQLVPPEIDRLVHAFDGVRDSFEGTRRLGVYILLTGFALIFTGLSTAITTTPIDFMATTLLVWGYGIAAGGGAAWVVGGGTQFATVIIEQVAFRRITGTSLRAWSPSEDRPTGHRGQINVQLLFGLVVLLLIGGALVTAATKLQAGLAASPAFSWIQASIIALLFLMAVVAMILGL